MIGTSAVVHGSDVAHGAAADRSDAVHEPVLVVWDNGKETPAFNVIGDAVDRREAVEVARWFAFSCGLPFADLGGRVQGGGAFLETVEARRHDGGDC